jgi:hypothetical protein
MLNDALGNMDRAERIADLLAFKAALDARKGEAESPPKVTGVSRIDEHQWVLDALQALLEAERERLLEGSASLLSRKP